MQLQLRAHATQAHLRLRLRSAIIVGVSTDVLLYVPIDSCMQHWLYHCCDARSLACHRANEHLRNAHDFVSDLRDHSLWRIRWTDSIIAVDAEQRFIHNHHLPLEKCLLHVVNVYAGCHDLVLNVSPL